MASAIFGISVSGLTAAQSALETISNNISNVNTAGYHRQTVSQTERLPFFAGTSFIGRGVDTADVSRVYDNYLDTQLSNAVSGNSYYQTQGNLVNELDNLMGNVASGLSPSLQTFFSSMQTLSSTPTSIPARQTVINDAQALTGQVQAISGQLNEIRSGINGQIQNTVASINDYAQQIATLNVQIVALHTGTSASPNDVLDQRDQVIQKLSQLVNVKVVQQADGSYGVFAGNGQALVLGGTVSPWQVVPDQSDPQRLTVAYAVGGTATQIPESLISGGQLGGLLTFRSSVLDRADSDLGRLAISISDSVNRQARLGRDLNNNPVTTDITDPNQGAIFTNFGAPGTATSPGSGLLAQLYPAPPAAAPSAEQQVALLRQASAQFSLVINDPAEYPAASSLKSNVALGMTASTQNTGNFGIDPSASPPTQMVAGVLSGPVTLTYDSNTNTFTASNGYTATLNGSTLTLSNASGIQAVLQTTGTPNGGDAFTVGSANTGQAYMSSVWQVAGLSPTTMAPLASSPPLVVTYHAATANFTATGPSASYTITPSPSVAGSFILSDGQGFTAQFQMSGTPADNDSFVIATKQTGPASADNSQTDNSNLRAIDLLQTQNTVVNTPSGGNNYLPTLGAAPNATFQSFFAQSVSYIGTVASVVQSSSDTMTSSLNQIQKAQQSFSGVNLDEEAASLIKFQQAYQASSKVIQIADQIFQSVLQIG
jgi:flagellar hook-associated protein 1 FlgK